MTTTLDLVLFLGFLVKILWIWSDQIIISVTEFDLIDVLLHYVMNLVSYVFIVVIKFIKKVLTQ